MGSVCSRPKRRGVNESSNETRGIAGSNANKMSGKRLAPGNDEAMLGATLGKGGFRTKVALKPGRSLMDWIRLGNNQPDLAGTGGRMLAVTPQELAKHNTINDAWMSIRGLVYNVTPYMEYHPGGEAELMRAAGRDGTDLFNEVHRWVNIDSLMKKVLVGQMVESTSPAKEDRIAEAVRTQPAFEVPSALLPPLSTRCPLRAEWKQTDQHVLLGIRTNWKFITADHVSVCIADGGVAVTVTVESTRYKMTFAPEAPVHGDVSVTISRSSRKIEIAFTKEAAGTWKMAFCDAEFSVLDEPAIHNYVLEDKVNATHDSALYKFRSPSSLQAPVPRGRHVGIYVRNNNETSVRFYTPVPVYAWPKVTADAQAIEDWKAGKLLYFLIKTYADGECTPVINRLALGEQIQISEFDGDYSDEFLEDATDVFLLAAGTGLTPMARLITDYMGVKTCQILLVFFNKTEEDRLLLKQLDGLTAMSERLRVVHVLSNASAEWPGLRGRVRQEILDELIPAEKRGEGCRVCICGPTAFTTEAVILLEAANMATKQVHAFLG